MLTQLPTSITAKFHQNRANQTHSQSLGGPNHPQIFWS